MPQKKEMISSLAPIDRESLSPSVQDLITRIRLEINDGKDRVFKAIEEEKKKTYWTVGKYIKQHILDSPNQSDYVEYVNTILAKNLEINKSTLYRCVRFYELYPMSVAARPLTWTHIKNLLVIPEKKTRNYYEKKIIEHNLTTRELSSLLKKDKLITKNDSGIVEVPKLKTKREKPYQYKLKEVNGTEMIDLGFKTYIHKRNRSIELSSVTHYTYKAIVLEIIDGDTLWVHIDLGFDIWVKRKLRLRDIDTPHIDTKDGQDAKLFIVSKLTPCKFVVVKTYWRDKFNRYLVDIFYNSKSASFSEVATSGTFLNQELLNEGLAVTY
jgi:endonuclease YncB( thermonuclease family)